MQILNWICLTKNDADYTAEKVRTICASLDDLRVRWADVGQSQQLAEGGIDLTQVAAPSLLPSLN
jgi:hypothetical protein